jgi:hypothetical protein
LPTGTDRLACLSLPDTLIRRIGAFQPLRTKQCEG